MSNIEKERKLLVISAIIFIVILLALFTAGIYFGDGNKSPFLQPFFQLANVIAAVSAGIMTSNLSGFLDVDLEAKFGKKRKALIRAGGGFAVFVLVLTLNPRNVMFDAAEKVYAVRHSECVQATGATPNARNGLQVCEVLVKDYPNRPEAHAALALYHGRKDRTESGYVKSLTSYREALRLYGISEPEEKEQYNALDDSSSVKNNAVETALRYATITAEKALLLRFKTNPVVEIADLEFSSFFNTLDAIETNISDGTDTQLTAVIKDLRAKMMLYESFSRTQGIDNTTIQKVAHIYENIANMELPIGFVPSVNWLVMQTCNDYQNDGSWTEKTTESFENMLTKWQTVVQHDIANIAFFKDHMKELIGNKRKEPYSVILMLGSNNICGSGMQKYFDNQQNLSRVKEEMNIVL